MCPNPSVSKKKSNKILKYQSDDLSRRIAFWTSCSNPHLRGIIFPYFFHVPEIRYIHKFPSLTDKDNRKVTIKRKQKWSKFISTPQSRFAFDRSERGHHKHRNRPPKNPKRKRYIYHGSTCVPIPPSPCNDAFRLARGVWKEAGKLWKAGSLVATGGKGRRARQKTTIKRDPFDVG